MPFLLNAKKVDSGRKSSFFYREPRQKRDPRESFLNLKETLINSMIKKFLRKGAGGGTIFKMFLPPQRWKSLRASLFSMAGGNGTRSAELRAGLNC